MYKLNKPRLYLSFSYNWLLSHHKMNSCILPQKNNTYAINQQFNIILSEILSFIRQFYVTVCKPANDIIAMQVTWSNNRRFHRCRMCSRWQCVWTICLTSCSATASTTDPGHPGAKLSVPSAVAVVVTVAAFIENFL